MRSTTNAKLFTAGDGEDAFNVLHVWGTPYEVGVAQGTILKQEVTEFIDIVYQYIVDQIDEALNSTKPGELVPHWLLDDVAEFGIDAALDLEIAATRVWTPIHFLEEIRGLADATGMPYQQIERIHLLGELTKGGCSLLSAYKDAVAPGYKQIGLRALDWSELPFTSYAQVTVYHPEGQWGPSGPGHAFANVGFTGFIGSFNAMSSIGTYSQEIGVTFPDSTFGYESRFGIPFTYLLRDLVQFDETIADAQTRIAESKRTCYLILGFGAVDTPASAGEPFMEIEYSAEVAKFMNSANLEPDTSWHPRIPDVVWNAMDWLCPNYAIPMHAQIEAGYGALTPEVIIENVTAIVETGSTFISIYAYETSGESYLYQAYGRAADESGPDPAYLRRFTKLSASALWAETKP